MTYNIIYNTLPVQKNHSNILSNRHLLWLWCTFAVALLQLYAMSQHLFPSRVALLFGRDFVLMTGESNHSFSLFQYIPNTFNGVKSGLWWWPINATWLSRVLMLHCFTTRVRWLHCHLGMCPSHQGKKKSIDGITWSFSSFKNSDDLQCLDLTNWSNPKS